MIKQQGSLLFLFGCDWSGPSGAELPANESQSVWADFSLDCSQTDRPDGSWDLLLCWTAVERRSSPPTHQPSSRPTPLSGQEDPAMTEYKLVVVGGQYTGPGPAAVPKSAGVFKMVSYSSRRRGKICIDNPTDPEPLRGRI